MKKAPSLILPKQMSSMQEPTKVSESKGRSLNVSKNVMSPISAAKMRLVSKYPQETALDPQRVNNSGHLKVREKSILSESASSDDL